MRNYSFNEDEAENFILGYKIIDNNIIVNYGNKKQIVMMYSVSVEKELLKQMRNQVLKSKTLFPIIKNKACIFFKLLLDLCLLFVMFLLTKFCIGMSLMATIIGMVSFVLGIFFTGYKAIYYRSLRDDIKKQWLFLDNESVLNLAIRRDKDIEQALDSNLRGKVFKNNKGLLFSLNTINRLSYQELNALYNQANRAIKKRKKIR